MKAKRLLPLLLVLCLLVSVLAPAASAAVPGATVNRGQASAEGTTPFRADRKDRTDAVTQETVSGHWTAEPTQAEVNELQAQLRADLAELRAAAETYADDDRVVAFLVLEGAPLAEKEYASMASAPAKEAAAMAAKQDKLVAQAQRLLGSDLEVRHQFTYLTNSVTVRVPFGDVEKLAGLSGVKSVFLAPVYEPCTASAAAMTGAATVWEELGYTGVGMKVAIIDTGLDLDHPSFAAAPALNGDSMTEADIARVLTRLNAYKVMDTVTADKLYRSEKIPYAFNYVDENLVADHSRDDQGYHGTHVAGIVAANPVWTSNVVGMAPDAQLVVMKVFGAAGGAYTDDIVAALEDSMTLGCDVANLSLGSPAGFSSANEEIDNIYARIREHDMIVAIAAGNEGTSSAQNMLGTDLNLTSDPDNATVSSPATYVNSTTVASAENATIMSLYFEVDGNMIAYTNGTGLYASFLDMVYEETEYVMVPGVGDISDYEGIDVADKVAVVSRGSIAFSQKLANAEAMGALALVVYNNEPGTIGMQMTDNDGNLPEGVSGYIPAVSISQKAGALMAAAEEKILYPGFFEDAVPSDDAGQMSSFSSWGVAPELRLLPDLTGIGGNVYSTIDGGQYEVMSGTSMATPQVAGCTALILQYLHETHPELRDHEIRIVAESLLMSTAAPIIADASGVEASPRQQGSGLVNPAAAISAESYLTVDGSAQPKVSMGDDADKTGEYSFTFNVHNMGKEPKTFTFDYSLLTEDYITYGDTDFMAQQDQALTGTVSFSAKRVTVAPGVSVAVTATVKLSDADKAMMDAHFENGIYVEGFVYVNGEAGEALSLPFLGFYGDWTQAPLMDEGFWFEESFWNDELMPTSKEYYSIVWTDLGGTDWVLGGNPYTGEMGTDFEHDFAISPNGDGLVDGFSEVYFAHLRNAETMTITFTDAETGEVVNQDVLEKLNKTMYQSSYGQVVPSLYTWYGQIWDFAGVPSGTRLVMNVEGKLSFDAHEQHNLNNSWSVPVMVDTQAPVLTDIAESCEDGRNLLTLTFADESAVALVALYDATFTHAIARIADYEMDANEDGTVSVTLDITGCGNELNVFVADYAVNETAYSLHYELDDNMPPVPAAGLYAYRVADTDFDFGDESYYGWVAIDTETAEVTQLTNDEEEYFALTAAEGAGDYVYGVDAGNNFVMMIPGLWTRTVIRPLDVAVEDMAYDVASETMYVLTRDANQQATISTIDLMTGEMTFVCDLGYAMNGPVAIAWANGKLYATAYYKSAVLEINLESGELTEAVAFDTQISPTYAQTMTYSAENNCLYWLAYSFSWMTGTTSALYTVDLDTMEYTVTDFDHSMEFIGAVTLEAPAYPEFTCDGEENCPSAAFTDLKPTAWYHEGVDYVLANGLMKGTKDTVFSPNTTVTRAQTVTILYRLAGSPELLGVPSFTDIKETDYYYDAANWASEVGITKGTSEGIFTGKQNLTREQAVTFLYRFSSLAGYDVSTRDNEALSVFKDQYTVSSYAREAMTWAVSTGLIVGLTKDTLSPKTTCTRAQFAAMLLRLEKEVMYGAHQPISPICTILMESDLKMAMGTQYGLTTYSLPWNAYGEILWTSSDETVATVDASGVITGLAEGTAVITASGLVCEASCTVDVVDVQGTVYAYDAYNAAGFYGDLISFELGQLPGYESLGMAPVEFVAGDYNGNDGCFYGFSETYQLYRWNLETGSCVAIGDPNTGLQIFDMAYDYSTGNMYASFYSNGEDLGGIAQVNMRTGALYFLGFDFNYTVYMPLACSTDGQLYAITAGCTLVSLEIDEDYGEVIATEIAQLPYGDLNYLQSMCYDHNNGNLVWAACLNASSMVWLDPETGAALIVGSPTGDTKFEYMGLFTVPEEIPELPYVPVEYMYAVEESMTVLAGGTKTPNVEVYPWNATNQDIVWTTENADVAYVNENGQVVGVAEGEAVIRGELNDNGEIFTCEIAVKVTASGGSVYGFLLMDMANYGGNAWLEFNLADPSSPEQVGASMYTFYSAEYVNGMLVGYCYDSEDWESPMYYAVVDPVTYNIFNMVPIENCPTVYDLTFDYVHNTLFAVAGYGDASSDLYVVDLYSGNLVKIMDSEPFLLGLAADDTGMLYAVASSEEILDEWGWPVDFGDAMLYAIDVENDTMTLVGDTGMKSNMMTSMTYDYASGSLYWAPLFQMGFGSPAVSYLAMTDRYTAETVNLGIPGTAGMQIGALYTVPTEVPEAKTDLVRLMLDKTMVETAAGEGFYLNAITIPGDLYDLPMMWVSSNTDVVTVDEDGYVTAVGHGAANVTVMALDANDEIVTATCRVVVYDDNDHFVAYSSTMGGWAAISRTDVSNATLLGQTEVGVTAAAEANGTTYAYGTDGVLYTVGSDWSMTAVGPCGVTSDEGVFRIRDMAYDAGTGNLFALGATTIESEMGIFEGSNVIYTVDTATGALTEFVTLQDVQCHGLAVTANSTIFTYRTFDDAILVVDAATGALTQMATLQSLQIYADETQPQSICYDAATDQIFMMITTNGNFYKLLAMDVHSYSVKEISNIGQTVYDPETWTTTGDLFAALVIPPM